MNTILSIILLTLLPSISSAGQFIPSCRHKVLELNLTEVAQSAQQNTAHDQQILWENLSFERPKKIDRTSIGDSTYLIYKTISIQTNGRARQAKGLLTFFMLEDDCQITNAQYFHHL